MVDRVGAAVVLCLATGAAAALAAWNVHQRRVVEQATVARTGLTLYWTGYALVFLQSGALLMLLDAGVSGSTVGLLIVQTSAAALSASAAGMLIHVGYLLRARDALTVSALLWVVLLGLLLVPTVLYRPSGLVTGGIGPYLVYDVPPPWWLGPAAGLVLALPTLAAGWIYLRAAAHLPGAQRRRATVQGVALTMAGVWTWWTVVLVDTPGLLEQRWAMTASRMLGLLPPFLMWTSQIFWDAPVSTTPPAPTNA